MKERLRHGSRICADMSARRIAPIEEPRSGGTVAFSSDSTCRIRSGRQRVQSVSVASRQTGSVQNACATKEGRGVGCGESARELSDAIALEMHR